MQELEGQLQPHRLHVGLLERGGDVHVHVQEALHGAALLSLLDLQLGEQGDKPGKMGGTWKWWWKLW